jgi:hypothetical protein
VDAARRLLAESRLPVKRISQRRGFGSIWAEKAGLLPVFFNSITAFEGEPQFGACPRPPYSAVASSAASIGTHSRRSFLNALVMGDKTSKQ